VLRVRPVLEDRLAAVSSNLLNVMLTAAHDQSPLVSMKYPCASNPSLCTLHQKYHFSTLTHTYPPPITRRCFITVLATETLQQISAYLDVVEEASFVLTCKAISCAVGTKSWDELSRRGNGKGKVTETKEREKKKEEWMRFLRLLERDDVRFLCCANCGILHYANLEEVLPSRGYESDCSGSGKTVKTNEDALSFCEGAYVLEPEFVRTAIRGHDRSGVCPQLLACEGQHVFTVAREKGLVDEDDEGEKVPSAVTELLVNGTSVTPGKAERQEHSWTHANIWQPRGGGLKTRLSRAWCRLREVRTTVQGHEWYFYFPMTLLCFLPRSRPYWVRQPDEVSELSADEDAAVESKIKRRFRIPWIGKRKTAEENATTATGEADSDNESEDAESYTRDGIESDDETGWRGYYHDLEGPRPVAFANKNGSVVPQFRQTKTFCAYESAKKGRIPWYDTPKNKDRLAWCNRKKHKWAEE
jgi:hypothetical protein